MAEENIETIRRAFVAWNARDFDVLIADSAPDVEWDFSHLAGWTERTTYRGLSELRTFWDLWLETWANHHLELLQLDAVANNIVFCRYRQTATGSGSGAEVEVENAQVITLRDGKVIRTVVYSDPDEAASAAGVPIREIPNGNAELPGRAVDAFNRRDFEGFLALIDPDAKFIPLQAEMEGGGEYVGHDGVRRWWENLLSIFPDLQVEIDEVRGLGEMTVSKLRLRGQGKGSDAPLDQTDWQAGEWRDGRAIWWRTFRTEAEALEAAVGLPEWGGCRKRT